MHHNHSSERSRSHYKPRFPRLDLLRRRRRDDDLMDPDRRHPKMYCDSRNND